MIGIFFTEGSWIRRDTGFENDIFTILCCAHKCKTPLSVTNAHKCNTPLPKNVTTFSFDFYWSFSYKVHPTLANLTVQSWNGSLELGFWVLGINHNCNNFVAHKCNNHKCNNIINHKCNKHNYRKKLFDLEKEGLECLAVRVGGQHKLFASEAL